MLVHRGPSQQHHLYSWAMLQLPTNSTILAPSCMGLLTASCTEPRATPSLCENRRAKSVSRRCFTFGAATLSCDKANLGEGLLYSAGHHQELGLMGDVALHQVLFCSMRKAHSETKLAIQQRRQDMKRKRGENSKAGRAREASEFRRCERTDTKDEQHAPNSPASYDRSCQKLNTVNHRVRTRWPCSPPKAIQSL